MKIAEIAKKVFSSSSRDVSYGFEVSPEGLIFHTDAVTSSQIFSGDASEWITAQYVTLKMLEEQGEAESIPNGFIVSSETISRLDVDSRDVLGLPPQWDGSIEAIIKGVTGRSSFSVDLKVSNHKGDFIHSYEVSGPLLKFGEARSYVLSRNQHRVFFAHNAHKVSEKSEFDNLYFLNELQECKKSGCAISLSHFDNLGINIPDSVTVEAEFDSGGNLVLTPFMGQEASHERVQKVLGQVARENRNTIKIGDEIILFDESKLNAVKEIISNRVIPKERVKDFLTNPTSYIDATLVDLDLGFSVRVHGATTFKHAYFGETDESGIDWFGKLSSADSVYAISKIKEYIKDKDSLSQFEQDFENASRTGSSTVEFEGKEFDVSNKEQVKKTISEISSSLGSLENEPESNDDDNADAAEAGDTEDETLVVDIDLNDEALDAVSPKVEASIDDVCTAEDLDWGNYARNPFPHQERGIRWILGLLNSPSGSSGGLLADDMGLGKTYMALSSIDHYYKKVSIEGDTKKPILIVAPLSLLEVWKDEVAKTFADSPFKDIVILQSNADLPGFREGGVEIRGSSEDELEPKYSLKVGKKFLTNRLDTPARLVITTYQTLRDYQFSLCLVDWGMVVFDEAQNIKNPNALQTRAAKGLKAEFKLVATGTPVENSLADFWCLMDTASPGFLGSYQEFREEFVRPILQAAGDEIEDIRARVGRELRIKVGALMLRRVKEDNLDGLPEKNIYVGIDGTGWEYRPDLGRMMSGYQLEVYDGTIANQVESDNSHVLTTLQRLRDSSLHPRLADGGRLENAKNAKASKIVVGESEKLVGLLSILDEIKAKPEGEKCIIFCVNKRLQAFLSISLGLIYKLGPLSVINGDAKAVAKRKSVPTRKSMITDFEAKDGFNIIIMSPVAAGVGLTVIGANHVIHLERHWNPAKEAQATDRVYRIGQQKDVHVYVPLLLHPEIESFDVNLHRLLDTKTMLKDAVVTPEDVLPNPGSFGSTEMLVSNPITFEDCSKLSWQQFEALAVEVLSRELGASSAWLTKSGNDFGADGVLTVGEGNVLIQVKHTGGKYDGYKAIQEVVGARPVYESSMGKDIKQLYFLTNATKLSKRSREIAKECSVDICAGAEFSELLTKHHVSYKDVLSRLDKSRLAV